MAPFKEEQILIIQPGTHTTLAQLGLPESFTPAKLRLRTRVFPAQDAGQYEPYKIRSKKVIVRRPAPAPEPQNAVDQLNGASSNEDPSSDIAQAGGGEVEEEQVIFEEDPNDDEDAIYPIKDGQVMDWPAFKAILAHIDKIFSPPISTVMMIVIDGNWTNKDREEITQFYFETYARAAVLLVDSALATCSAYGLVTACVVDVGFRKTSISPVCDFDVVDQCRIPCLSPYGGDAVSESLIHARKRALAEGEITGLQFTFDMAEQLKKQPHICEVLPSDVLLPLHAPGHAAPQGNPAAAASTGTNEPKAVDGSAASLSSGLPRGPGAGTQTGQEKDVVEEDGVLDLATIVASGKTNEFLAKKEQEKAQKAAQRKSTAAEPVKPVRLPNSQKAKAIFRYQEKVKAKELHSQDAATNGNHDGTTNGNMNSTVNGSDHDDESYVYQTKEIEVGTERFGALDEDIILGPLCYAVHWVIEQAPIEYRSELWNNVIIVGNGSKVKGAKERIIQRLIEQFKVTPSNASIFTSDFPSNFTTPLATGANTPLPQHPGISHHNTGTPTPGGSGVNPLLLAATTASQNSLAPPHSHPYQASLQPGTPGGPGGTPQPGQQRIHQHIQNPTSIKHAPMKEYFPEWKDHGFEEATFLGAQVLARTAYIMDNTTPSSYMTRVNYNEEGPAGIHGYVLGG